MKQNISDLVREKNEQLSKLIWTNHAQISKLKIDAAEAFAKIETENKRALRYFLMKTY